MNKNILITFLLLLLFCNCSNKLENIYFLNKEINLGDILENKIVKATFTFINNSKTRIKIEDVISTCGCLTIVNYDKIIPAGKKGEINIELDSKGLAGKISRLVIVKIDSIQKNTELVIQANIKSEIELIPPIVWLGEIKEDTKELTGVIEIVYNANSSLKTSNIHIVNSALTAIVETLEEGKRYKLKVNLKPPYYEGYVEEKIIIDVISTKKQELEILCIYHNLPGINISPKAIYLNENKNTNITRTILIENNKYDKFNLTNIISEGNPFDYIIKQEGKNYYLTLFFPANFIIKKHSGIAFTLKDRKQQFEFRVPIFNIKD